MKDYKHKLKMLKHKALMEKDVGLKLRVSKGVRAIRLLAIEKLEVKAMATRHDKYAYRATWSEDDNEYSFSGFMSSCFPKNEMPGSERGPA
jgi:hypothetical protein